MHRILHFKHTFRKLNPASIFFELPFMAILYKLNRKHEYVSSEYVVLLFYHMDINTSELKGKYDDHM